MLSAHVCLGISQWPSRVPTKRWIHQGILTWFGNIPAGNSKFWTVFMIYTVYQKQRLTMGKEEGAMLILRYFTSATSTWVERQMNQWSRLAGQVFKFQIREVHWRAEALRQKQRNQSGLNNLLGCLVWGMAMSAGPALLNQASPPWRSHRCIQIVVGYGLQPLFYCTSVTRLERAPIQSSAGSVPSYKFILRYTSH